MVDTINRGQIHIEEVDLDGLVQGVVSRGLLSASLKIAPADVFVIAVPTPFDENHAPDISYVLSAASAVAPVLKAGDIVILESTSPVGTTEQIRDLIAELRPDLKVPGKTSGYVLAGVEFSMITPFVQELIESHIVARCGEEA